MTYRSQGVNGLDGEEPLGEGPAGHCPACGRYAIADWIKTNRAGKEAEVTMNRDPKSPIQEPRAWSPSKRVSVGIFRRCKTPGNHLHESCSACGHAWLTAFASAT